MLADPVVFRWEPEVFCMVADSRMVKTLYAVFNVEKKNRAVAPSPR